MITRRTFSGGSGRRCCARRPSLDARHGGNDKLGLSTVWPDGNFHTQ